MQTFNRLTTTVVADRVTIGCGTSAFINNGQLWVCGDNEFGQLGLGDKEGCSRPTRIHLPERIRQVSTTPFNSAVVTESGQLWVCGDNDCGQLGLGSDDEEQEECRAIFTRVDLPEPVKRVTVANCYIVLIAESERLWVCGDNYRGQLGLGDFNDRNTFTLVALPERVLQVAASTSSHIVISTESGQLWSCGNDDKGQLGLGTNKKCNLFTRIRLTEQA